MAKVKETTHRKQSSAGRRGGAKRERGVGTISSKNQLTIPVAALREAGFRPGDRVRVEASRSGEIRLVPADETPAETVRRLAERAMPDIFPEDFREQLARDRQDRW